MSNILNVFFRKSPKEVLFRIDRMGYTRQPEIYRGKEITFSHALKLINKFEKGDIITKEKIGREYRIKLTEKGRYLYDQLQRIMNLLEEEDGLRK